MKSVEIRPGVFTLVDDEDEHLLLEYKWGLAKGYVSRNRRKSEKPGTAGIYLARVIMNAPPGMEVDHINHNPLDNRRHNLRVCSRSENQRYQRKRKKPATSKYKGVHWYRTPDGTWGRWQARIKLPNQYLSLGYFNSEEEAAIAYNTAALLHYGEFACLNEIDD